MRVLPFVSKSSFLHSRSWGFAFSFKILFMPTSITTAPSFTISSLIRYGTPVATISISASLVCIFRSFVSIWQIVTVAHSFSKSSVSGFPTSSLCPTIVAFAPLMFTPSLFSIWITPEGVAGTRHSCCATNRPIFTGWKPSTSFSGLIASRIKFLLIWAGRGNCTSMPCISSRLFNLSISASTSRVDTVSGIFIDSEAKPTSSQPFCLFAT
ncbi:MAG: hypothetical protein BWY60_00272 [Actinobacteria bacterium ADurb.Bin346]|nr:MAG: hypothetical protein BWY60_00272 [Actinobacteria bacterium ADurb.Bin346]